jgi:hypothetical protein
LLSKHQGGLKQFENEKKDLMFLSDQKDAKIKDLEKQVVDLGTRLDKNLKKQTLPTAQGASSRGVNIKNNPVVQNDT